jgi:hypothetical protein
MRLVRVAQSLIATYGVLIQGSTPFAVTLERPWLKNQEGLSCITAGVYECVRGQHRLASMDHDFETFEITGVPGRSKILFHKGNVPEDSHGCVLVGEAFNPVLGKPGITESGHGFDELMQLLRMTDRFPLSIIDAFDKYMLNEPAEAP